MSTPLPIILNIQFVFNVHFVINSTCDFCILPDQIVCVMLVWVSVKSIPNCEIIYYTFNHMLFFILFVTKNIMHCIFK